MPPAKKHKDFEAALRRLEEITEELESGDTSLEKSLELYTEGLEIARFCTSRLTEAEKRIKVISEKGGITSEEDFGESEEST
jgi:exodeoxyribonuclease VII small subunit